MANENAITDDNIRPVLIGESDTTAGETRRVKVSEDGAVNTKLTGRTVVKEIIVNAVALTSMTQVLVSLTNKLKEYKEFEIFITNTLDQPVKIGFNIGVNGMRIVKTDGTVVALGPTSAAHYLIPSSTISPVLLSVFSVTGGGITDNTQWKKYRNTITDLVYKCDIAPTSGAISIFIEGVPN